MRARIVLLLSFLIPLAARGADRPAPVVRFTANAVTVETVTPRGDVVLLALGREALNYHSRVFHHVEMLADEDGDGVVHCVLPGSIPRRSVWAAVDVSTGAMTVAAPQGYAVERADFPGNSLHELTPGTFRRMDLPREMLFVLIVRPNAGAWTALVRDGSARDDDRALNGRTSLDLDALEPVGRTAGRTSGVTGRDVIVAIDPADLNVFTGGGRP